MNRSTILAAAMAAFAAASTAMAAPPADLTEAAVRAWAAEAGAQVDKLKFIGATPKGAYFAEANVRTPRNQPAEASLLFEKFDPATGEPVSETATLTLDCQLREVKIGEVKTYPKRNGKGGGKSADAADWAAVAPAQMQPMRTAGLIRPSLDELCRTVVLQRRGNAETAQNLQEMERLRRENNRQMGQMRPLGARR